MTSPTPGRGTQEPCHALDPRRRTSDRSQLVEHLDDHASDSGHWLKLLKSDERALFTAAGKADESAAYLLKPTSTDAAAVEDDDGARRAWGHTA